MSYCYYSLSLSPLVGAGIVVTPTAEMSDDISRSMSEYGCINICITKHGAQTARQPLLASRNPDHLTMWGIVANVAFAGILL